MDRRGFLATPAMLALGAIKPGPASDATEKIRQLRVFLQRIGVEEQRLTDAQVLDHCAVICNGLMEAFRKLGESLSNAARIIGECWERLDQQDLLQPGF